MTLGCKIQALRKKAQLTQDELADLLQVSRQALSKWENDLASPDIDKIVLMSNIFSVSTDYLLKDDNENYMTTSSPSARSLFLTPRNLFIVSTLLVFIGLLISIGAMADGSLYIFWRTNKAIPGFVIQLIGVALFMIIHDTLKFEKHWIFKFMLVNVWLLSILPHLLYSAWFVDTLHRLTNYANIYAIVLQSFHLLFAMSVNGFISLFLFIRMKKIESA